MQRLMTWLEKEIQKKQAAKTASSPTPEQAAKAASSQSEVEIITTQYNKPKPNT
jgi:hypothetical protein